VVTDDGTSTTSLIQLHDTWSATDTETGIAEYQYAIGTTSGGTDILGWTSDGTNTAVTKTGLALEVGKTYYFSVKAKNGEEMWSAVGVSNGISVEEYTPEETPHKGGGVPVWAWVLIGLGIVAAMASVGLFVFRRLAHE
jgi:hypothetical protein